MEQSRSWHAESITPHLQISHSLSEIVFQTITKYQKVEIINSRAFGQCLILDGKTQSSEADEYIYHESLVHPAAILHSNPETVFIGGGGEGATLREILKHKPVKKVVMVDIDEEIIAICKKYLLKHHQGAFNDPRLELHIQDARSFLGSTSETFDLVILDFADPIENGPASMLYTKDFYKTIKARLNPKGILVTQAGPTGNYNYSECFTSIINTLKLLFETVAPSSFFIPSFGTPWGIVLACDIDLEIHTPASEIDLLLRRKVSQSMHYYDGISHQNLFSLPRYLRKGIAEETRVISDTNPLFIT